MPTRPARWAAALLTWMTVAVCANAELVAWLDFDGAIKGEATELRHKDWIEIIGFEAGADRVIGPAGAGGGTSYSRPVIADIGLVKFTDRSSPALFRSIVAGDKPFPKVTLDLTAGAGSLIARVELEDVLLSEQKFIASQDGRPVETIWLNFTKITYTYFVQDGGALFSEYDIELDRSKSGTLAGVDPDLDSDGDGMPDWWERLYGLNPDLNDANEDFDGDGFTNLQEFQLGTNPASGSSFFKATMAPSGSSPGSYEITWNSVAGKSYVIEWSPDLATPFTALRTVTATAASSTEVITTTGKLGFYRVRPE
jgi:type VI secretion system secreted protein Hcp